MRKGTVVFFDRVVAGPTGTVVYTDTKFNDILGQYDKLSVHCISDQKAPSAPTMSFVVDFEHSNDGENWVQKTASWINRSAFVADTQYNDVATDAGSTPTMALVRLKVTLTVSSGNGSGHIKMIACMRDES